MRQSLLVVALALGGWGFVAWRAFRSPPPLALTDPRRLIEAADLQVETGSLSNAMGAYTRAVHVDTSGVPQRIRAAKLLWFFYAPRGLGSDAARRRFLFQMANFLNFQKAPDLAHSEGPFWLSLAYVELAGTSSQQLEAQQWLDMASGQADLFEAALPELPGGVRRLSDLHSLRSLISLRRYDLTKGRQELREFMWRSRRALASALRNSERIAHELP